MEWLRDRLIDAHVHVWSPDVGRYPLAPGFGAEDLWLPQFTPEDHRRYSASFGKVRLNLVQMTWYGLDHRYILDLIAQDPQLYCGTGIVAAVADVSLPRPDRCMRALAAGGIGAFRVRGGKTGRPHALGDGERWLDHPGYEQMFAAAAEDGLALSFLMGVEDLPELDRMCRRFPEAPVILDHVCGLRIRDGIFPEEGMRALAGIARHRKVMVKLGPMQALGDGEAPYTDVLPLVQRVVEAFGPERCMWESDSGGPVGMKDPERDFAAAVELIAAADFLSEGDKERILVGTAEGLFF